MSSASGPRGATDKEQARRRLREGGLGVVTRRRSGRFARAGYASWFSRARPLKNKARLARLALSVMSSATRWP